MGTKGRLQRFKTYESPGSIGDLRHYELTMPKGKYLLTVQRGAWEYSLQLANGDIVSDTFHGMNEALYKYLEDGWILTWLKKIERRIAKEEEREGIHAISVNVGYATYLMKVHKKTGEFWIYYPGTTRGRYDITSSEFYTWLPDLPMIGYGDLVAKLRPELEKLGVQPPETPYFPEVGFRADSEML